MLPQRHKRKPSPSWFELSVDILWPAIGEKRKLTKEYMYMYYRRGNAMTKAADALVEWGGAKLQN